MPKPDKPENSLVAYHEQYLTKKCRDSTDKRLMHGIFLPGFQWGAGFD